MVSGFTLFGPGASFVLYHGAHTQLWSRSSQSELRVSKQPGLAHYQERETSLQSLTIWPGLQISEAQEKMTYYLFIFYQ